MFCIHCGQQLPDDAQFCFRCGKKPLPAEQNQISALPQKTGGFWKSKAVQFIALGLATVLLAVAVVIAIPNKPSVIIPDPEVYFALPLTEKSTADGRVSYQYHANADETAQVAAYVHILREDHGFVLLNATEQDGYAAYQAFHMDDSDAMVDVTYIYDRYQNTIVVKVTKNVGFEPLAMYAGSQIKPADKQEDAKEEEPEEQKPSSVQSKETVSKENGSSASAFSYQTSSNPVFSSQSTASQSTASQSTASQSTASRSTSSRSSGTSTPQVDLDRYDVKSRCGVCHGSGDCRKCGGDGKIYSSASKKEDRNCTSCSGRGRCRSCGGDGWVGED